MSKKTETTKTETETVTREQTDSLRLQVLRTRVKAGRAAAALEGGEDDNDTTFPRDRIW